MLAGDQDGQVLRPRAGRRRRHRGHRRRGDVRRASASKTLARDFAGGFDAVAAGETFGEHLLGAGDRPPAGAARETDRDRIFNLGYFTWVEQQGVSFEEFEARRRQAFWTGHPRRRPGLGRMIEEFNERTGVLDAL